MGRRLPISEATAAVITAQKDWTRRRYPRTPPGDLALFPCDRGNRDGTKPIRADAYGNAHRVFADEIARLLLDADGQQVNPALVVPYVYRHSYAQRHADAGVQPDVKAGGHACPYKYTCTGCGHFRSDPSYLPELKSYLLQLLADRERLHAATDLQPWARAQVRELIRRIETDLETLSDTDRAQIQQAVTAIRAARQTVMLGMPAIRPAAGSR